MKKEFIMVSILELLFLATFFIVPAAVAIGMPLLFFINEGVVRSYIREGKISLNSAISYIIKDFLISIVGFSIFVSIFFVIYWSSAFDQTNVYRFIIEAILFIAYVAWYPIMNSVTRYLLHKKHMGNAFKDTIGEVKKNKKEVVITYLLTLSVILIAAIPKIGPYLFIVSLVFLDFMPIIYENLKIRKFKAQKHQYRRAH